MGTAARAQSNVAIIGFIGGNGSSRNPVVSKPDFSDEAAEFLPRNAQQQGYSRLEEPGDVGFARIQREGRLDSIGSTSRVLLLRIGWIMSTR